MIQVVKNTTTKGRNSASTRKVGGNSAPGTGPWAKAGFSRWMMRFEAKIKAARMATKMSKLQPARRPSLPIKILRRVDAGGGVGSTIGGVPGRMRSSVKRV